MSLNNKQSQIKNKINTEVFSCISLFLVDVGFTSRTTYIMLKRRLFHFSLITGNSKSVNLKLKVSRFNVKKNINSGLLVGFYRAV